ncbi:hypothetical protein J6590_033050 [Homalodisca vitripennis]|nr:hypothetical protein J6590_033050 [Homalodisca vitripennis]
MRTSAETPSKPGSEPPPPTVRSQQESTSAQPSRHEPRYRREERIRVSGSNVSRHRDSQAVL